MSTKRAFLQTVMGCGAAAGLLLLTLLYTQTATMAATARTDLRLPSRDWWVTAQAAAGTQPLTCNGRIDGQVSATYTGATLSSTRTDYTVKMSCTAGPHGETMTALQETPVVRVTGKDVHEGPLGQCAAGKAGTTCTAVESKGSYACTGAATCAGDYQIGHRSVMVLPAGFEWTDTPASCHKASPRDLRCLWYGGVVTVRETLPPSSPSAPSSPSPSALAWRQHGSGVDL